MDTFFSTIYDYTRDLYSQELDNYLYETVPGYIHVGLVMVILSAIIAVLFYYILKPVRKQMFIWLGCLFLNALLNLIVAIWYTNTPLIHNEIDESDIWTVIDTFGFGVANIIWSILFFILVSIFIKNWSPAKYIPFKKF